MNKISAESMPDCSACGALLKHISAVKIETSFFSVINLDSAPISVETVTASNHITAITHKRSAMSRFDAAIREYNGHLWHMFCRSNKATSEVSGIQSDMPDGDG
jgi:hypothetical protein